MANGKLVWQMFVCKKEQQFKSKIDLVKDRSEKRQVMLEKERCVGKRRNRIVGNGAGVEEKR